MSAKVPASDLYPVVYRYLTKCGHTKSAAAFLKDTKRSEKSLQTKDDIVSMYATFKSNRDEESSSSDSDSDSSKEPAVTKPKAPITKAMVATTNKKRGRSSSSSSESSSGSSSSESDSSSDAKKKVTATATKLKVVVPPTTTKKESVSTGPLKKKMKADSSSSESSSSGDSDSDSDSSDSDSSEEESSSSDSDDSEYEKEAAKRLAQRAEEKKKKALEAAKAAEAWIQKSPSPQKAASRPKGEPRISNEAFRRVDAEYWNSQIIGGLEDNSYEKAFGQDGYGAKASNVLMQVRGKDFRHEKTKKKRGSYTGGNITMASNSFKYDN